MEFFLNVFSLLPLPSLFVSFSMAQMASRLLGALASFLAMALRLFLSWLADPFPGGCPFLLPGTDGKLLACTTVTCRLCFAMTSDPVSVPCNMCAFCVLMEVFFLSFGFDFLFFVCFSPLF